MIDVLAIIIIIIFLMVVVLPIQVGVTVREWVDEFKKGYYQ